MKYFFILLFLIKASLAVFRMYHSDYYHPDSVHSGELKPTLNQFTCAYLCNGLDEFCSNFVNTQTTENCKTITNNGQGLVKTSSLNKNAVKVWSNQEVQKVPHFLIIHYGGSVEDYTMDSETSPKIDSYGQFPKSGRDACAIFYPDKMKVIMRQKTSKELMEWNFDDQTAKYTYEESWDKDQNSRPYGPCATSSSGKLFLYSGNLDKPGTGGAFFYQGNRTKTMTALYERYLGCAAFHPTDDNIVFIIGGHDENGNRMKTNFKVHLDDGSHHNLKDLDYTLVYHTCMGFVKKDGRPSIMIAGGIINSGSYTDSVVEYDIDANTYNTIQSLPDPIRRSTLINSYGYMYNFGGYNGGSKASVSRIALSLTSDWETLDDMVTAGYDVVVIPYNV